MKIWILLLMLLVTAGQSASATEPVVTCGMGPAPDSPEFVGYNKARREQSERLGHSLICEENLRPMIGAWWNPVSLESLKQKLDFPPTELSATSFAGFQSLGAKADHHDYNRGKSGAVERFFVEPGGAMIRLKQVDLTRGACAFHQWPRTEKVRDQPAQLSIVQTPSKRAQSCLVWSAWPNRFELCIDRNVRVDGSLPGFIALANELPATTDVTKTGECDMAKLPPGNFFPPEPATK